MKPFSLSFLKRAENFAHTHGEVQCAQTGRFLNNSFCGSAAIDYRFKTCSSKSGIQDSENLKEFKRFRWMLSAEQEDVFEGWCRDAIISGKTRCLEIQSEGVVDIVNKAQADLLKQRRESEVGT